MSKSPIQWCTDTWNPVTGCTQIPGVKGGPSGCDHCYAKRLIDTRMSKNPKSKRFGNPFEIVMMHPERLEQPLHWKSSRRIFVNSLSDLFHADVTRDFIDCVFYTMMLANHHTYQVLTKRPERMWRYMNAAFSDAACERIEESTATVHFAGVCSRLPPGDHRIWPPPNVWLGTSISTMDDQWRADWLRKTRAAVRFLSLEPLLGPIDSSVLEGMSWVIVGGESGPGARPMSLEWAYNIRDACQRLKIPFFLKQIGKVANAGKGHGGDLDEIPMGLRVREFPDEVNI